MKLRNKKTGEIECVSIDTFGVDRKDRRIGLSVVDFTSPSDYRYIASYSSLAELNEEWEDYAPAEPLIKDEKIRKAVRAWADANVIDPTTKLKFDEDDLRLSTQSSCIEFEEYQPFKELADGAEYTIAELCGEEEE